MRSVIYVKKYVLDQTVQKYQFNIVKNLPSDVKIDNLPA